MERYEKLASSCRRMCTPRQLRSQEEGEGQALYTFWVSPYLTALLPSTHGPTPRAWELSWVLAAVTSCRSGPQSLGPSGTLIRRIPCRRLGDPHTILMGWDHDVLLQGGGTPSP